MSTRLQILFDAGRLIGVSGMLEGIFLGFMPLMIIATFVIIPIPAGVLLYLITSNIIQIAQTVIINKQIDAEQAKKKEAVNDDELKNAKKVDEKK